MSDVTSSAASARSQRAEARRTQVIEAARQCFREAGFHTASMARIAEAAGMSVGQIYRFFPSKEAIIEAIVEQGVADKLEHIAAIHQAARERGVDIAQVSAEASRAGEAPGVERQDAALMLEIIAEAARNPAVAAIVERNDRILREEAERMLAAARPHWSAERIRVVLQVLSMLHEGRYLRLISDPSTADGSAEALRGEVLRFLLED